METFNQILEENKDVLNRLKTADEETYKKENLNPDFTVKVEKSDESV